MHKSKLLSIIKALKKDELTKFDLFLASPYFVNGERRRDAILLFEIISACFPSFDQDLLSKENIHQKLFPGQTFTTAKVDKVMTSLLKLLKRFISVHYATLSEQEVEEMLVQARFYRQRELGDSFHQTIKQLRKALDKKETKDKNYYHYRFQTERELSEYKSFYNNRKEDLNLPSTLKSLDVYYLVTKLEYACWLLAQNKFQIPLEVKNSLAPFKTIPTLGYHESYLDLPIVAIYYQAFIILQEAENDNAFYKLKALLIQHEDLLPIDQLKPLQALCRNFCVRQYNKGQKGFLKEAFDLYKLHLKKDYLSYHGGLLQSTFRNIVAFGLKLEEFDWVYNFLEAYKNRIVGTNHPQDSYEFNLASYYFAVQDYDQALTCLVDHYEDFYYKIIAKRLEIKIFFETNSAILDAKMDAFKIFIYRLSQKMISDIQRQGNNNFIDVLRQIRNPKTKGNEQRIGKIALKINELKVIAEKEWLMEKLENSKS